MLHTGDGLQQRVGHYPVARDQEVGRPAAPSAPIADLAANARNRLEEFADALDQIGLRLRGLPLTPPAPTSAVAGLNSSKGDGNIQDDLRRANEVISRCESMVDALRNLLG